MTAHLMESLSPQRYKKKPINYRTFGFVIVCLCMAILSCRQVSKTEIKSNAPALITNANFDIKALVNAWISEMQNGHYQLEKTVHLGNESETRQIDNPDWKREWSLFLETDLNSLILKDEFIKSEEKKPEAGHTEIYTALKNKQLYRKIVISFDPQNKPVAITIHKAQKSFLANMDEYLDIDRKLMTYRIEKREKVIFSAEEIIVISGKILTCSP